MSKYPVAIYRDHPEIHIQRRAAARLARVSVRFIHACEREELIACRRMLHGRKGLCVADVCKLKRIRHLHEDMGLDLEAVDFVLRYQDRLKAIQSRLKELEHHSRQKEREYQSQIMALRQRLSEVQK